MQLATELWRAHWQQVLTVLSSGRPVLAKGHKPASNHLAKVCLHSSGRLPFVYLTDCFLYAVSGDAALFKTPAATSQFGRWLELSLLGTSLASAPRWSAAARKPDLETLI